MQKAAAHKVEANHFGARPRSLEVCEEFIAPAMSDKQNLRLGRSQTEMIPSAL